MISKYFPLVAILAAGVAGLDRRPTISFITQPEIVTDIGGKIEMLCSVQYAQVKTNSAKFRRCNELNPNSRCRIIRLSG